MYPIDRNPYKYKDAQDVLNEGKDNTTLYVSSYGAICNVFLVGNLRSLKLRNLGGNMLAKVAFKDSNHNLQELFDILRPFYSQFELWSLKCTHTVLRCSNLIFVQ